VTRVDEYRARLRTLRQALGSCWSTAWLAGLL
jgi:hypothetical protein